MIEELIPQECSLENFKRMHEILIENQCITYPGFKDDPKNFDLWINNLKKEDNYHMLLYKENDEIIGFLNYGFINEENWIAEIQIDNKEKNKGITKKLLKRFYNLNKNKIKEVYAFINPYNNLSKEVFINHVGFKKPDGYKNRYILTINDLKNYLEK